MRYQAGFAWSTLGYEKIIYINPRSSADGFVVPGFYPNDTLNVWGGSTYNNQSLTGKGWYTVNGTTGDGLWHSYEIHIDRNTCGGTADGVIDWWIDGVLVHNQTNAQFSCSNGPANMREIVFGENQSSPSNGGPRYLDYDDITISNTGYIGPINNGAPVAPTNVLAVDTPSDAGGSITLTWTPSVSQGVTEQRVYRGTPNCSSVALVQTFANNTTATWANTGLTNGTTYCYLVRSYNGVESANSGTSSTAPVDNTLSVLAPTNSLAVDTPNDSGGQIDVSWTPSVSANITEQRVLRSTVSGSGYALVTTISGNTTNAWRDTGRTNGTPYYYVIRAWNGSTESANSNEASASSADNSAPATLLLRELCDDADFAGRGWYDIILNPPSIDTAEAIPASSGSCKFMFSLGSTNPTQGAHLRHTFTNSDTVSLRFYTKHGPEWVGSGRSYHPHTFYFLTSVATAYNSPAFSPGTYYVEQNGGHPRMACADGQNIDQAQIGVDLTGTTQNRSVCGGNGILGFGGSGYLTSYYLVGTNYWNDLHVQTANVYFSDTPGTATYKGDWHYVEACFTMNSILAGVAQADGKWEYWHDGTKVIDVQNAVLRTATPRYGSPPTYQTNSMQFAQLLLDPYIGDGSPVQQSFWLDDIEIHNACNNGAGSRLTNPDPPAAPRNLTISKSGAGTGTVTSNPIGVNCGGTCVYAFDDGQVVALAAAAADGSTFVAWSGSGCGAQVTMSTDRSCTAQFDLGRNSFGQIGRSSRFGRDLE